MVAEHKRATAENAPPVVVAPTRVVIEKRLSSSKRLRITSTKKLSTPSKTAWEKIFGLSPTLTKIAIDKEVRRLHACRKTTFDPDNQPSHDELLRRLWASQVADEPYTRSSERWKEIGFQGVDPATDVRGGGLLAATCICEFGATFASGLRRMLRELEEESNKMDGFDRFYPISTTAIVICSRLCDVIGLSEGMRGAIPPAALEKLLADGVYRKSPVARLLVVGPRGMRRSDFQWMFSVCMAAFHVKFIRGSCTYLNCQPLLAEVFAELEQRCACSQNMKSLHRHYVADRDIAACLDVSAHKVKESTVRKAAALVRVNKAVSEASPSLRRQLDALNVDVGVVAASSPSLSKKLRAQQQQEIEKVMIQRREREASNGNESSTGSAAAAAAASGGGSGSDESSKEIGKSKDAKWKIRKQISEERGIDLFLVPWEDVDEEIARQEEERKRAMQPVGGKDDDDDEALPIRVSRRSATPEPGDISRGSSYGLGVDLDEKFVHDPDELAELVRVTGATEETAREALREVSLPGHHHRTPSANYADVSLKLIESSK